FVSDNSGNDVANHLAFDFRNQNDSGCVVAAQDGAASVLRPLRGHRRMPAEFKHAGQIVRSGGASLHSAVSAGLEIADMSFFGSERLVLLVDGIVLRGMPLLKSLIRGAGSPKIHCAIPECVLRIT